MKWIVSYYNQSVVDSVEQLDKSIKAKYLSIVDSMIEQGSHLGMPFTKAIGNGLFEIRAKGQAGIARGFFCTLSGNMIVILHVFVKKTEAIPQRELTIAKRRMKEVKNHGI